MFGEYSVLDQVSAIGQLNQVSKVNPAGKNMCVNLPIHQKLSSFFGAPWQYLHIWHTWKLLVTNSDFRCTTILSSVTESRALTNIPVTALDPQHLGLLLTEFHCFLFGCYRVKTRCIDWICSPTVAPKCFATVPEDIEPVTKPQE
jgi:hypothetical protein